jgi:uncharacterized membrane protein YphA (DoxX/SURF4 family)
MRWKYPFLTALFLILLRLAIGWHFLYEGYHKVHSLAVGSVTRPGGAAEPFSSASYFREAHGPLGDVMRHAIGDPDEHLLERLSPASPPEGKKPHADKHLLMPPALARDWDSYFNRFVAHYGLDEKQQSEARAKLEQAEAKFVDWLTTGSKAIVKTFPSGTVDVTEANARRVEEYRDALRKVQETYTKELPAFGRDVEKIRLRTSIADVASQRKSLEADLDEQTGLMKKALTAVLTDSQRKMDEPPPEEAPAFLKYLDAGTAWFLFIVGGTLLFGLFTRTSCVLAAGFLLMTYLNTPALPWLPVPPNQEGSYYFVSKNVIEMLALLTLATTPSGRWFGIDGILRPILRSLFGRKAPATGRDQTNHETHGRPGTNPRATSAKL